MEADCLNEREKAAVLWAEHVTKNTARNRDDIFEIIKKVYSESEIVELTAIKQFFPIYVSTRYGRLFLTLLQ